MLLQQELYMRVTLYFLHDTLLSQQFKYVTCYLLFSMTAAAVIRLVLCLVEILPVPCEFLTV